MLGCNGQPEAAGEVNIFYSPSANTNPKGSDTQPAATGWPSHPSYHTHPTTVNPNPDQTWLYPKQTDPISQNK